MILVSCSFVTNELNDQCSVITFNLALTKLLTRTLAAGSKRTPSADVRANVILIADIETRVGDTTL